MAEAPLANEEVDQLVRTARANVARLALQMRAAQRAAAPALGVTPETAEPETEATPDTPPDLVTELAQVRRNALEVLRAARAEVEHRAAMSDDQALSILRGPGEPAGSSSLRVRVNPPAPRQDPPTEPHADADDWVPPHWQGPPVEPPVQPAVEPSVQPAVEPSVQPAVEPPVQPAVEPPVQPAVELPVQPAVEQPSPVSPLAELEGSPGPEDQDEIQVSVPPTASGAQVFAGPVELQEPEDEGSATEPVPVIAPSPPAASPPPPAAAPALEAAADALGSGTFVVVLTVPQVGAPVDPAFAPPAAPYPAYPYPVYGAPPGFPAPHLVSDAPRKPASKVLYADVVLPMIAVVVVLILLLAWVG